MSNYEERFSPDARPPRVLSCAMCKSQYLDIPVVKECPHCGLSKEVTLEQIKTSLESREETRKEEEAEMPPPLSKWDLRFMEQAMLRATWSKHPATKVGAVVVDERRRSVLGDGYNGFPRGIEDSDERMGNDDQRRALMVHAEMNAILDCPHRPEGATLYLYPIPPCSTCTGAIIQSGIKRVVVGMGKAGRPEYWLKQFDSFSRPMLEEAGVSVLVVMVDQE